MVRVNRPPLLNRPGYRGRNGITIPEQGDLLGEEKKR
jgi:hypothetical protein